MNESEKKELVDAYNEVARNVCEAVESILMYDRDMYRFEKVYKKLFERGKNLERQARQSGFKFVEIPPRPNKTGPWAEFELQEINKSTCN